VVVVHRAWDSPYRHRRVRNLRQTTVTMSPTYHLSIQSRGPRHLALRLPNYGLQLQWEAIPHHRIPIPFPMVGRHLSRMPVDLPVERATEVCIQDLIALRWWMGRTAIPRQHRRQGFQHTGMREGHQIQPQPSVLFIQKWEEPLWRGRAAITSCQTWRS